MRNMILAACLIALSVGVRAQQALDSSQGMQLAGKLTFGPKVDPIVGAGTLFKVITTSGETIELLVSNARLNTPGSISAAWGRILSPSNWAAIRFVNIALHGAVPVGHSDTVTRCLPEAVSRNEISARFVLQCVGHDEDVAKQHASR